MTIHRSPLLPRRDVFVVQLKKKKKNNNIIIKKRNTRPRDKRDFFRIRNIEVLSDGFKGLIDGILRIVRSYEDSVISICRMSASYLSAAIQSTFVIR